MILDFLIVALLLFAVYRGWKKGAITMFVSILVLVTAIIIATLFATPFGKAIGVGPTLLHPVTGFFILFIIILIIASFIKRWIKPKKGFLAGADKIFGAIFGFLRAVLLLGLLFGFLRIFQLPSTRSANSSIVYPMVLRSSTLMVSQLKPLVGQLSSEVYDDMTPNDTLRK